MTRDNSAKNKIVKPIVIAKPDDPARQAEHEHWYAAGLRGEPRPDWGDHELVACWQKGYGERCVRGFRLEDPVLNEDGGQGLWGERIPRALSLISAREGTGKGLLVAWEVGHLTAGRTWPDGIPCEPVKVMMLNSEDSEMQIRWRLAAQGANGSNLTGVVTTAMFNETGLSLIDLIHKNKEEQPDLAIVYVDVASDFLRMTSDRDVDVKNMLDPVKALAMELKIGIRLVHHENKANEGVSVRDRAKGSSYWTSTCRAHAGLIANPQYGPTAVVWEPGKTNNVAPLDPIAFDIVPSQVAGRNDTVGKLIFKQIVPRGEYRPVTSESGRGRSRATSGDAIIAELVSVITKGETHGSMRGCPARDTAKDVPANERQEWAALVVADKLGVSVSSVRKQWFENIQDKVFCVDGRDYVGWCEQRPGRWMWCVKESPNNTDSPTTAKPDDGEAF